MMTSIKRVTHTHTGNKYRIVSRGLVKLPGVDTDGKGWVDAVSYRRVAFLWWCKGPTFTRTAEAFWAAFKG